MFQLLVGLATIALFERLASMEEESRLLWGLLAAGAFFLPSFFLGPLWALGGVLVAGAAFTARVMTRKPRGRGPVR